MARTPLHVAADQVAAAYRSAGLRAVLDIRDLNPPAALIALDSVDGFSLNAETYTATWHVYLVSPNTGADRSLSHLSRLFETAVDVFEPMDTPTAVVGVQLPAGGDPLPALDLTIRTRVTPD